MSLSVCVNITLLSKSGLMYGAMSAGVPHEAFCQVLFLFIDANWQGRHRKKGLKYAYKWLYAVLRAGNIKPLTPRKKRNNATKKPVIMQFTGYEKVLNAYISPLRFCRCFGRVAVI